ncbi:hypothetical protein OG339_44755 [Streptosporangium sp. NBC_01495]|uniref:hypothetical protein n=1 Tax=Streptosporangium sp. NBC_01495 TaxID=2903899 RepID=UPI002E3496EC|nr:hypothetical protein [Streptosporangium sp. NBC_01495]
MGDNDFRSGSSRSDESISVHLDVEMLALLNDIYNQVDYYIPLNLGRADPCSDRLKFLVSLGYIRWCPYPEEFYKITPQGIERLGDERRE